MNPNFNQFQNKPPGLFSQIPNSTNIATQPIQRNQNPSKGKLKKDLNYYKRRGDAKRKIEQAIQELEMMNSEKGRAGLKDALEILKQLETNYAN